MSVALKLRSWEPSPHQMEACRAIAAWARLASKPPFYLAGYAGTGKTTLADWIAREIVGGNVVFGAFTGKAAAVMRQKGCANADTLDSLIYRRHCETWCVNDPPCANAENCAASPCHYQRRRYVGKEINPSSPITGADVTIVDEVSMVGRGLAADLLSFGTPVLVIGDPAQLAPPRAAGFFTNHEPNFLLTEIHRQAAASPIISMATYARNGVACAYGERDGSAIVREIAPDEALKFDQIICGLNRTRVAINRRVRELLGRVGDMPVAGEKLVCLRNNRMNGLRNGTLWTVRESAAPYGGFIEMEIEGEDGDVVGVEAPVEGFDADATDARELPGDPFTYGYAITAHKSQGSQWPPVLVFDESRFFRADRWRWLYTAITRAADRVTVVRQ